MTEVDLSVLEFMDFLMGFMLCGAISLTLYLIFTRKKKK